MLPKLLTETLCSLKSKVDRLAFSVIWEMDDKANIVDTRYKKTVIHSKASLEYEEAYMKIIDQNDNSELKKSIV